MSEWDDAASGWDDSHAVRIYAAAAFDSLCDVMAAHGLTLDGLDVCDFGCGTGLLTQRLAPLSRSITAVDASPAMLDVLDRKITTNSWSHVATMRDLPTRGARFDLIVCSSVCAFVDDYPATVERLVGLLRPGGVVVQWDWEFDPDDDEPFGLTRQQIRDALTGAGLGDVDVDVGFTADVDGETMRPVRGSGRRPEHI
jgi:2-polyprenyl-3-methyl-5-hydroxy-6-metoxy-1,4-benzoquinol methylase